MRRTLPEMLEFLNETRCKKCEGRIIIGISLVPVWGRLDGKDAIRGDTLNMVDSKLEACFKCFDCGHSFPM